MKHIQSNEPQTHDVLQDYILRVEASRGNLKPVHVIRKILLKTESVMIGKIVTF